MIQIIDYQITQNECQELIDMGSKNLTNAATLGTPIENYRVAENTWIYSKTELTDKIKKLISDKTGLPIEHQEQIHIVKYNVGGEYKTHHDFFHPNTDYYDTTMKSGGQRVYSCLFYLNDEFEGGEFQVRLYNDYTAPLEKGTIIAFPSILEHRVIPVTSGIRYSATMWFNGPRFR